MQLPRVPFLVNQKGEQGEDETKNQWGNGSNVWSRKSYKILNYFFQPNEIGWFNTVSIIDFLKKGG